MRRNLAPCLFCLGLALWPWLVSAQPIDNLKVRTLNVTSRLNATNAYVGFVDAGTVMWSGTATAQGTGVSLVSYAASGTRVVNPVTEGARIGFGPDTHCFESGTMIQCTAATGLQATGFTSNGGDVTITGATGINWSGTQASNYIAASCSAANTTSSTPCYRLRTSAALDADDLLWGWQKSDNSYVATIDNEGDFALSGREIHTAQAVTGTDDGAGTNRAVTITPSSSFITLNCQDTNGCDITMSETGAVSGSRVCITAIGSAGASNFADSSGVSELAGAFAAGQWDSICMLYVTDRWVEIGRSNN